MNASIQSRTLEKKIYTALIIAVVVTLFLFFIDEGYYNFNWVKDPANWFAFLLYVTLLFIPQLILIAIFIHQTGNRSREVILHIAGIVIGITSAFLLFG